MMHPAPPMILFVPEIIPEPFTTRRITFRAFYELWVRWGRKKDRVFWQTPPKQAASFL